MFENKTINGIHASRYIASWTNAGGELYYGEEVNYFYKWLLTIGLTEEEAKYVKHLATNGKLELENSAEKFIDELQIY